MDGDDDSSSDAIESTRVSKAANGSLTPSKSRPKSQALSKNKLSKVQQQKTKETTKLEPEDDAKSSIRSVASEEADITTTTASKSTPSASKKKAKHDTQALDPQLSDVPSEDTAKRSKRKRKTKEEKEAEAMPLAPRTPNLRMFVGAHTSIAKGVENAITNALHIGGNAFACFLKSQRKWDNPSLKDENRDAFRSHLTMHKFDATKHVVPHGSYLVNLASGGL